MDKIRVWAAILGLLIVAFMAGSLVNPSTRAQEPSPSPTPINQHWTVKHGDIEALEEQLHTLNVAGITIDDAEIRISDDGKRFVIATADASDEDEGN